MIIYISAYNPEADRTTTQKNPEHSTALLPPVRSFRPTSERWQPATRSRTIPDGLPHSDADATQDPAALCDSTMKTCLPHFKNLLDRLNDDGDGGVPPVTCVVADNIMSFGVDAAKEIGVPCLLFWTASACGYMGYRHFQFLMDEGLAPLKGSSLSDD